MKKFVLTITMVAAGFSTVPAQLSSSTMNLYKADAATIISPKTDDLKVGGKWNLNVDAQGQKLEIIIDLTQEDKTFTGTMSSPLGDGKIVKGVIKDQELTAVVQANIQGQDMEIQMAAKIEDEKMIGSFVLPSADAVMFEGVRAK